MKKTTVVLMLVWVFATWPGAADAQDKKRATPNLISSLKASRVIELNFVGDRNSPLLGLNPPFTLGLQTSHKQTSGMIPGGIAFAADMMFFSGQHGSPNIDALGHISDNMKNFGGVDAAANEGPTGLLTRSEERRVGKEWRARV